MDVAAELRQDEAMADAIDRGILQDELLKHLLELGDPKRKRVMPGEKNRLIVGPRVAQDIFEPLELVDGVSAIRNQVKVVGGIKACVQVDDAQSRRKQHGVVAAILDRVVHAIRNGKVTVLVDDIVHGGVEPSKQTGAGKLVNGIRVVVAQTQKYRDRGKVATNKRHGRLSASIVPCIDCSHTRCDTKSPVTMIKSNELDSLMLRRS